VNGLRFTVTLPTERVEAPDEFGTASAVMEMAKAAEDAGFDACNVTDHPFPPATWIRHGGHHTLDPLVALSFAGAATTNLRLHTNIYVPAYRNPFLTAKAVATLDTLTGGRVIFGVAAGYLRGEFDALGVPFERRGARLDTALLAMRQAWTGEPVKMETQDWAARDNVMLPGLMRAHIPPFGSGATRPPR
jgi:alkanesulfonate monooxygenase SsuD/methylene tetrahydromethanopterin reductase-like flavin-dependent oxidoreductase (luciferase family)